MSWFDEAVAKRQRMQGSQIQSGKGKQEHTPVSLAQRQHQEVESFNPLLQRLLSEYGDHVYGKSFLQRRFMIRLERPGATAEKSWNWHWHLDSLVKNLPGLEVHPQFADDGTLTGFLLISGAKHIKVLTPVEDAIQGGLVSLYLK